MEPQQQRQKRQRPGNQMQGKVMEPQQQRPKRQRAGKQMQGGVVAKSSIRKIPLRQATRKPVTSQSQARRKDDDSDMEYEDLDWELSVVRRGRMALVSAAVRAGYRLSSELDLLTDRRKEFKLHACSLRVFPLTSKTFSFDVPSFVMIAGSPKEGRSALEATAETFVKRGTLGGVLLRRHGAASWEGRPFGAVDWTEGSGWQAMKEGGARFEVRMPILLPSLESGPAIQIEPFLLLLRAEIVPKVSES